MKAVLFDFDGVVADTEPLYDLFWTGVAEEYRLGIPDFAARIKGTTLDRIFKLYFSGFSPEETGKIARASAEYEQQMDFREVPGALHFLCVLKEKGFKLALVTSSNLAKMQIALKKMRLETLFNTVVTADRITRGKPDPMGYLLAAADLEAVPGECVVFEDSFSGIEAARAAGMRVIGVSTTNGAESLRDKVFAVIPDFSDTRGVLSLLSEA